LILFSICLLQFAQNSFFISLFRGHLLDFIVAYLYCFCCAKVLAHSSPVHSCRDAMSATSKSYAFRVEEPGFF
jgi:hypothetical protein